MPAVTPTHLRKRRIVGNDLARFGTRQCHKRQDVRLGQRREGKRLPRSFVSCFWSQRGRLRNRRQRQNWLMISARCCTALLAAASERPTWILAALFGLTSVDVRTPGITAGGTGSSFPPAVLHLPPVFRKMPKLRTAINRAGPENVALTVRRL